MGDTQGAELVRRDRLEIEAKTVVDVVVECSGHARELGRHLGSNLVRVDRDARTDGGNNGPALRVERVHRGA